MINKNYFEHKNQNVNNNMSDVELKHRDLIELSKMCAAEYNMPEFSDRVLVFDVMQDGSESTGRVQNIRISEPDVTCSESSLEPHLEQKRRKQTEPDNEIQAESKNFVEQSNTEIKTGSDEQNKSDEQTCEQAESKQVVNSLNSTVQENWNEPLRQHKIYVHSLWLAAQSSYFRSLLHSSGMKETYCTDVHLKISESEENAHLILVQAMYRSDVLNDKSVDELLAVLELADMYDVKFVFRKCKYILQKNATTFEISTQIMHVIKVKHNMNDVEDLAATLQLILAQEFSPLDENWQSEKFSNLSEPSVKYLLCSDDLIVQSENTVFHALMHWMEHNDVDPASLGETNDLLAAVRFKLVTIDYLYNVIKNHPIASKMPKFMELCFAGMTYHAIPPEQKELLKDQPVLRKKTDAAIKQHTFVVRKEDFDNETNNRTELHLDEFWACGYKMKIDGYLNYSGTSGDFEAYLSVNNLNQESLVYLEFSINKMQHSYGLWKGTFKLNGKYLYKYISLDSSDFNNDDNACKFSVVVKLL